MIESRQGDQLSSDDRGQSNGDHDWAEVCPRGPGAVTSATVADNVSMTSAAAARALTPCAPAPIEILPRIRWSAMTGQGCSAPKGVMVPRSYQVTARAVSASGIHS